MVKHHADDEHGRGPADGSEHPLPAVLVLVLLSEKRNDGWVGKGNSWRAEKESILSSMIILFPVFLVFLKLEPLQLSVIVFLSLPHSGRGIYTW